MEELVGLLNQPGLHAPSHRRQVAIWHHPHHLSPCELLRHLIRQQLRLALRPSIAARMLDHSPVGWSQPRWLVTYNLSVTAKLVGHTFHRSSTRISVPGPAWYSLQSWLVYLTNQFARAACAVGWSTRPTNTSTAQPIASGSTTHVQCQLGECGFETPPRSPRVIMCHDPLSVMTPRQPDPFGCVTS